MTIRRIVIRNGFWCYFCLFNWFIHLVQNIVLHTTPADHIIGGLICHCPVAWSSMVLYFYYMPIIIYISYYLVFKILSSFVRDSSYHDIYYKGCGLLCAHKKSFNTAIPVRSLGPYMYVHYCTCIVHILVWAYLFRLTSFFDYLSFMWIVLKHPYKRFCFFIFFIFTSRDITSNRVTYNLK